MCRILCIFKVNTFFFNCKVVPIIDIVYFQFSGFFCLELTKRHHSGVEPALPSPSSHSDVIPLDQDSILPHCDPIPPEHVEHSRPWIEVHMTLIVKLFQYFRDSDSLENVFG